MNAEYMLDTKIQQNRQLLIVKYAVYPLMVAQPLLSNLVDITAKLQLLPTGPRDTGYSPHLEQFTYLTT